ncbi:hypothetical protein F5148DRAFT_1276345 [Russula earlei]|uniref:Uncharacterized protein n=1 Tax=Russula earlei TaxID=71964 RepID=A0ACC0U7L5_9AGAM|nr:hypothetical protein F5148DRAFT_1276345 [Russula earlei]
MSALGQSQTDPGGGKEREQTRIAHSTAPHSPSRQPPNTASTTAPIPRGTVPRPRPISLPPPPYSPSHSGTSSDRQRQHSQRTVDSARPRTTNRILGEYTLSKTLGAGSMGKVKLAHHNVTGEKLAVKILPRVTPVQPIPGSANAEAAAKQASKDASKEIRTIREAALSQLLYHPYICGMREMIVHQHHYYMVFEYINGGQMLDYIISHGRLRERVARKFARQIGSALEYCHKNNVVHRDLKIENILISQTGNIKIIDFGLSNLYDPVAHLSTFCGSLYFAAPELLNAKVYTGPEVDVWSFGVVLYVLVCGKVPFDDQSMPALHAKIKRGLVEYPVWLSTECKHILSRMLVTNPQLRSSLPDLLNHPWMTRGFNGPPDPHLLRRDALRADELDRQVIHGMAGFEFGSEDDIERRLVAILDSEAYKRAVQYWENKRERPRIWNDSLSNSSLAIAWDGAGGQVGGSKTEATSTPKKSKRFSGFDFYRRKLFSPSTSPPPSPFASPSPSQSQLSNASLSDVNNHKEPPDPTRGYHPLISIYYLAREKMERDRVYGVGHFASSQLSLNPPQPAPEGAPPPTPSKQAVQLAVPASAGTPQKATGGADYTIRPSRLPAPESLHFSKMSYDSPVTPSPTGTTFQQQQQHPRFRARDAGLPIPKQVDLSPPSPIIIHDGPDPTTDVVPAGPASATLPRAPPASTHRRSHSVSHRQGVPRGLVSMFGGGGGGPAGVSEHGQLRVNVHSSVNGHDRPRTAGPELTTFSEHMEDEQAAAATDAPDSPPEVVLSPATPPSSAGATFVRKFGNLLVGGSIRGAGDRAGKRTSILSGFGSPRPSADLDHAVPEGEKKVTASPPNEKTEPSTSAPTSPTAGTDTAPAAAEDGDVEMHVTATGGIAHSQTQPLHRRAATILDPQGHAKRHERRSSTGGALLSSVGGTIGRHRRPSTSHGVATGRAVQLERPFAQTAEVPEEDVSGRRSGPARVNGAGTGFELTDGEDEPNPNAADKDFKPVFLKGLFSVATTSTKPPAVLKTDIRRVLDRMQVQYRETKTGFDCIHLPSIDISSLQDPHGTSTPTPRKHRKQSSTGSGDSGGTTRRIVRKASKLSFGMSRKDKDRGEGSMNGSPHKERDKDKDKELPGRPSVGGVGGNGGPMFGATPSSGSSSFFNVSSNTPTVHADDNVSATLNAEESPRRSHSPVRGKNLPPIPRDFGATATQPQEQQQQQPHQLPVSPPPAGEVIDREVFESVGQSTLSVRFEVNIVPWLPLHGIQFRRASGDGWQYQMLARRVLTELKL